MFFRITLLCFLFACTNAPQKEEQKASAFYFPEKKPVSDWCYSNSSEAVPMFPDEKVEGRVYFMAQPNTYRFVSRLGNTTASCYLKVDSTGRVGVYTAQHLPQCMSKHENFSIDEDGLVQYNNERYMKFEIGTFESPYGAAVYILPGSELQMGLNLYRCANCR